MRGVCSDKIEYLDDLINGLLSKEEETEVLSHLAVCESCRVYYDDMKALRSSLSQLPLDPPPDLSEKILIAVKEQEAVKIKTVNKWLRPAYIVSYAAACLVLAFALIFYQGGFGGSKNFESSEILSNEEQSKYAGAERSNNDSILPTDDGVANEEASVSAPESDLEYMADIQPGYTAKVLDEEGFKFNTSAFKGSNSITYNERGTELFDTYGYEKSQDILYFTANYSTVKIVDILYMEFNIKTISSDESSIYIELPFSIITAVEKRLDLVSSYTVEVGKKSYMARIVSLDSE